MALGVAEESRAQGICSLEEWEDIVESLAQVEWTDEYSSDSYALSEEDDDDSE